MRRGAEPVDERPPVSIANAQGPSFAYMHAR